MLSRQLIAWAAQAARSRFLIPLAVLVTGLLASTLTATQVGSLVGRHDGERFAYACQEMHIAIKDRLDAYLAMLQAGAGLFAASRLEVSRSDFRRFAAKLHLADRYPSVQGFGFIQRVSGAQDTLLTAQAGDNASVPIWPEGRRPEYYPITFLEPPDRRNQAALGYDMSTEPMRRAALDRARDTGVATVSGKLGVMRDGDHFRDAGFLIYVPVYESGDVPTTLTERRQQLFGFVFSSFKAGDLFRDILGEHPSPFVAFAVYDGSITISNRLFRSEWLDERGSGGEPSYRQAVPLTVGGRQWTIVYQSTPAFTAASNRGLVTLFFLGGVVATVLLAGTSWFQLRARRAAEAAQTQAQAYSRQLELLNDIGRQLTAELDVERLLQSITDASKQLSGAEFGAFFQKATDGQGEYHELHSLAGAPKSSFQHLGIPRNTALFAPTFLDQEAVRSDDLTADKRYGRNEPHVGVPKGHLPIRSYLAVPVVSRSGAVMGALLFGHRAPNMFTAQTEQLMQAVAAQAAIAIDNAELFQASQREIADRRRLEEQLVTLALHDPLTQLPNRVMFADRLEHAVAAARRDRTRVAAVVFDLDGFKDVNDRLGHPAGDRLLQEFAARIRRMLRETDTLARFGGDEFALVQPSAQVPDDVVAVAQRIAGLAAEPMVLDGEEVQLTASIGIAIFPEDARTPADLLRAADVALYRAKEEGRSRYRFYERAMDERARQRRVLERELKRALKNNEFIAFYQPQIDLRSHRVAGVEALLRWQHPERGLVLPGTFIDTAERSGLIRPLGRWILREACRQGSVWRAEGTEIPISVNLSPVQLREPDLIDAIEDALADSQLPPHLLELELTETVLMDFSDTRTRDVLRAITERGVRLAVDDFGEACSVLNYLREPAIARIKISQSFVGDLPHKAEGAELVRAVIVLAHTLGREVVAEAVETEEQLEFLRRHDCDLVQGFLIARPAPAAELHALIHEGRSSARVADRDEPGLSMEPSLQG